MQCREIQELLKTDYLDGEAGPGQSRHIREHLVMCAQCRRLEEELLTQRVLFKGAKRQEAPERVWQNIRGTIIAERFKQESVVSRGVMDRLKELVSCPRPVFALASALTVAVFVLVIAGTFVHNRQSSSKINAGEIIAGYNLNGESANFLYDLGTNVERYFL